MNGGQQLSAACRIPDDFIRPPINSINWCLSTARSPMDVFGTCSWPAALTHSVATRPASSSGSNSRLPPTRSIQRGLDGVPQSPEPARMQRIAVLPIAPGPASMTRSAGLRGVSQEDGARPDRQAPAYEHPEARPSRPESSLPAIAAGPNCAPVKPSLAWPTDNLPADLVHNCRTINLEHLLPPLPPLAGAVPR